jgi:hypothetical protein
LVKSHDGIAHAVLTKLTSVSQATRNLVLVHEPYVQDWSDLEAIAAEVRGLAPDIEVFIASNDIPSSSTRRKAAGRPALIFSPTELRSFQPLRGKIYAGALITKDVQLHRLAAAGVPVPDYCLLTDDLEFDPGRFGPLVLIKPTGFTSHGRGIEIALSSSLAGDRWRRHPALRTAGNDSRPLLQRFIDTGEYPSHYRILTLFGEPIFGFRAVSTVPRPAFATSDQLPTGPLMARHGQRRLVYPVEQEVLSLARRTFDAIPEVALHGCDIIRETGTNRLFVLEINPGGNTWSFSSGWAPLLRSEMNVSDLSVAFDAWRTCARVLVQRTRSEAI